MKFLFTWGFFKISPKINRDLEREPLRNFPPKLIKKPG